MTEKNTAALYWVRKARTLRLVFFPLSTDYLTTVTYISDLPSTRHMRIGQILVRVISSRIVKEIRLFVVTLRRNGGGSLKILAEHVCLQGIHGKH